jgi:hypothetical protein
LTQLETAADPSNHIHEDFHDDIFKNHVSINSNKTAFRAQNNSIIVSQVGSVVQLPCKAHLVGNETVNGSFPLISFFFLFLSYLFNRQISINIAIFSLPVHFTFFLFYQITKKT